MQHARWCTTNAPPPPPLGDARSNLLEAIKAEVEHEQTAEVEVAATGDGQVDDHTFVEAFLTENGWEV